MLSLASCFFRVYVFFSDIRISRLIIISSLSLIHLNRLWVSSSVCRCAVSDSPSFTIVSVDCKWHPPYWFIGTYFNILSSGCKLSLWPDISPELSPEFAPVGMCSRLHANIRVHNRPLHVNSQRVSTLVFAQNSWLLRIKLWFWFAESSTEPRGKHWRSVQLLASGITMRRYLLF